MLASEMPKPETTIAACSTLRDAKAMPGTTARGTATNDRIATPARIAMTGAPRIGAKRARYVAAAATAAATSTPGTMERKAAVKERGLSKNAAFPLAAAAERVRERGIDRHRNVKHRGDR